MSSSAVLFLMTLIDFQGLSPIASFSKCDFSCSYAAVDKILTDIEHHI